MEKSMLTEIKAILRSLVISCPDKITIEKLNRDYRDVEGQFIPYRQLGYDNLEKFLRSIPDTLRVFGNGSNAMVCFVANEKSGHIHDMIMKQKKPESKGRSRISSKKLGQNRSNAFRGNSSNRPFKTSGQPLSPYQSVNRNQMVRTLQIKPFPQLATGRPNNVSIPIANQLYNVPQPNGINTALCTVQNGIIKPINSQNHLYQNQVHHVNSLLRNQCFFSKTPPISPLLQRLQNMNVSLPKETKSSIEVASNAKKESIIEHLDIKNYPEVTETKKSPIVIKPSTNRRQVSLNLPAETEDMPKLAKPSNNMNETTQILNTQEPKEAHGTISKAKTITKTQPKRCFDDSTDCIEDPDEAIPSFAAKNNVFRLDFPECSVPYGDKIARYKLPSEITVGSCLKVFITEIHSPFKFWFHIYKENHELDLLMYKIERYYSFLDSDDLRIPMMCLTPGQVCAASYNGLWHRAEIVAPPVNKSIKVSFMDYGTVTEVDTENIKFLATAFAELPAQALRGCLSHIKPREYHWSHEATNHFLKLVAELMLYAKITEIDNKNNVLYMILCDTNGEEAIQINSSLVNNKYAFYNEEWKADKIKENNGIRCRHPREDFPTFSMIESGDYPSFHELVSLRQRGVNYETISDLIIFNQSAILNKHESASEGLKNLPYFLTNSNPFRSEILLELYATTSEVI